MINFVRRICNRIDNRALESGMDLKLTLDAQYAASVLNVANGADAPDLPFALLSYYSPKNAKMNVGDAIQTIAVKQALEQIGIVNPVDEYLVRDELSLYRGRPVRCIMQGWFSESRLFWPSPMIRPVFVGTHLTLPAQQFLSRLLTYAPHIRRSVEIGCRDHATLEYCKAESIGAYLSRCLTLTFPCRPSEPRAGKVFLVDVPDEYLPYLPQSLKQDAVAFTQRALKSDLISTAYSPLSQMELGKDFLGRYRDEAAMVVTTAIHVAMPCIAMGIPVCFIEGPATRDPTRYSVLDGIVPINSESDLRNGKVDFRPAPVDIRGLKELLLENLRLSIEKADGREVDSKHLSEVRMAIAAADGVKR